MEKMSARDYLTPFVEVGRALSDNVDNYSVMNLIAQRITETLQLKGTFIKLKGAEGEGLELVSSHGLSEHFLLSEPVRTPDSVCFQIPSDVKCFPNIQENEEIPEQERMLFEGIRSAAIIPVEVEHDNVGLVGLFAGEPREFQRAELTFAATLAGQGVLSIFWQRRVERYVEVERAYLKTFQEISCTINETLNINKVLELVVNKVSQILGGKGCTVRLLDPKTQSLYLAQAYGLSQSFLEKGPVDAQKSIVENMAGRIVVIEDVFTDPRLQYPAEVVAEGIRKILSIPLSVRGKVIGVLRVFTGPRAPFTQREIHFASAIAQQCAFAIENARMYQRVKYEYQQMMIDFGYEGSGQ